MAYDPGSTTLQFRGTVADEIVSKELHNGSQAWRGHEMMNLLSEMSQRPPVQVQSQAHTIHKGVIMIAS